MKLKKQTSTQPQMADTGPPYVYKNAYVPVRPVNTAQQKGQRLQDLIIALVAVVDFDVTLHHMYTAVVFAVNSMAGGEVEGWHPKPTKHTRRQGQKMQVWSLGIPATASFCKCENAVVALFAGCKRPRQRPTLLSTTLFKSI